MNHLAQIRERFRRVPITHNIGEIRLWVPGRNSQKACTVTVAFLLIVLSVMGSVAQLLPGIVAAFQNDSIDTAGPGSGGSGCATPSPNATVPSPTPPTCDSPASLGSNLPSIVGAGPVPSLSLPHTVLSSVDGLIGAGGIIQHSPDNLTLYNSAVKMRLLGGLVPHDELLGAGAQVLSSWSFWGVEANMSNVWVPLVPNSNTFNLIGTNRTGTYVIRSMQVGVGAYSGILRVAYKATTAGALSWDLDFTATAAGHYRLVYLWLNVSSTSQLVANSKSFRVGYRFSNYTLSWSDVPSSLNVTSSVLPARFALFIDLGHVGANSRTVIDPSIVSTSTYSGATDYSFQRKVFYDPKGGHYFVFYYDGFSVGYSSSSDGITWSSMQPMPSDWPSFVDPPTSFPSVASYGGRVVVAVGDFSGFGGDVNVHYAIGTVARNTINWGTTQRVKAYSHRCAIGLNCAVGVRFVYAMLSPNGDMAFSYNAYFSDCSYCNDASVVDVIYLRGSSIYTAPTIASISSTCNLDISLRSVVVQEGDPANGVLMILYEYAVDSGCFWPWFSLRSVTYSSTLNALGVVDVLDSTLRNDQFSAASDAEYGTHLVYVGNDWILRYQYHAPGSSWTSSADVFQLPTSLSSPTVTVDLSTDTVYVFALWPVDVNPQLLSTSTVIMRSKSLGQSPDWSDVPVSYQFKFRILPAGLGSSLASASTTNSSSIALVWTEGVGPYNVTFGSIPIQRVWSPYSFPSDPWDGRGLAPYGQYFQNLDQSVSSSTGMLTVSQTDLSVPGRGINLEITRVFTGGGIPYSQAPMGNGWQLNLPSFDPYSQEVHLWNGESYRYPANWIHGCFPCRWENHQGEYFSLVSSAAGTDLVTKSGLIYHFDCLGSCYWRLTKITDPTGNNTITFTHNPSQYYEISSMTDTVGRLFLFCYDSTNNVISRIEQVSGGTCGSETGLVRKVSYAYVGWPYIGMGVNLASVTDPAGRITSFQYNALSDINADPSFISRITYPTGWYSNYTYVAELMGNAGTGYRVSRQIAYSSSGSIVRQFSYAYYHDSGTDQVTRSTVTTLNGTSTASYTDYSFSYAGVKWNVSDANHNLVRGEIQLFGVHGEVPQEIIIVTDGAGHIGSYSNSYRYDQWGNLIYSRTSINPSTNWYHEAFNAYYSNGLPTGFYSYQETFSRLNNTLPDNPWFTYNGTWRVNNGVFNGTSPVFNPTNQAFFAWTNSSSPSVSIIGSVYITKPMASSDQRVGLIAHYPGHGMREWALVLHNSTSGTKLSLLDETVAWVAENPCTLTLNTWYKFNFTISGKQAWGSASAPGISCSVSSSFTSNDIAAATGFGLYAGGYVALFDNVTATTVAPGITGTSFSNSFIQNGAPNSNIHGALAGTAQLQNGTGTIPIETYYSYYSWGGLNQEKNRYDPPQVVDGSAIANCSNNTSSCSVTLTTSSTNDVIIVYVAETLNKVQTSCTFSVNDTAGLTWTPRSGIVFARNQFGGYRDQLQEFYAKSTGVLSSDTITESISGCGTNYNGLQVFAMSGANFNSPFDPSSGVPGVNQGESNGATTSVTVSTSNPNSVVIAGVQHGTSAVPTVQSGFAAIFSTGGYGAEYQVQNAVLTNFAVTFGFSTSSYWEEIADAIQPAAGTQWGTQWRTSSRTYDNYGNPKTFVDQRGNTAYNSFSANYTYAYLTNQTRLDGLTKITTLYAYNFTTGNVRIVTDPKGNATSYQNDNLGRVKKVTYPIGAYTQYTYNDAANYVDITNENGWKTRQIYDGLGRQKIVDRFLNAVSYSNETYSYDWQNNVLNRTDEVGNVYRFKYDALRRPVNATTPNGKSTLKFYNDLASWVRSADEDRNYRCNVSDRLGRLVSVVEKASADCQTGIVTNYYYDEVGNFGKVMNAVSKSTEYSFDNLGQLTKTTYPDNTAETYTFDNNGNIANSTDRKGVKTMRSYDSLNRVKTITYCGPPITSTSYTYDKDSNPLTVQNQNATITYTYDARNRPLSEKYEVNLASRQVVDLGCSGSGGTSTVTGGTSKTYTVTYSYDGELLDTVTYPTISTTNIGVKYAYDGLGRVLSVTKSGTSTYYARSFTYYKNDRLKGLQFGNGLIGNYTR